jgi:class 3 adenylate cyclase/putative methionine-R-sulfoxide reductase with GAF domain
MHTWELDFGASQMQGQTIEDENVRLRAEVEKLREREAASQEILGIISQNRSDERPVLDAITQNAVKLCDASGAGLWLSSVARDAIRLASVAPADKTEFPIGMEAAQEAISPMGRCMRDARTISVADIRDDPYYLDGDPTHMKMIDEVGIRSRLIVPLVKNGIAFGCISLIRKEVRSFSDDEVTLIESFAEQAVIAIENVRQFREVQTRLAREQAAREILGVISQSRDEERPVFDTILQSATRLCKAPLAFLSTIDEGGSELRVAAHRGARPDMEQTFDELTHHLASSEIVSAHAARDKRIIRIEDMSTDVEFDRSDPRRARLIDVEGVRSYLVVPMLKGGTCLGTLNLYRREVDPFSDDDVALANTFAAQAVIAIENARQYRALANRTEEVEKLNTSLESRVEDQVGEIERMARLKRFLPAAVADTVISSGSEKMLKSHRALLGVLFCDIRGFTAFCETAEPEETIEVLQTYHEEMGKLINAHGAGVDHRMGDGIMVLFNDPIPCNDPAGDAVRLAVAMRGMMAELCVTWKRIGHRLGFGVGVSLGYATVGMVGFEGRSDYTASGTAVNLAARLCDEAKDGEILLSPRAAIAVEDDFPSISTGEVTLKGIREPVEVFRWAGGPAG